MWAGIVYPFFQYVERARRIGRDAGLHHVYTGNVHDTDGGSTRCPSCGTVVGRRPGTRPRLVPALAVRAGAVQALGQDARDRGLADATRAGEQIGVVQALLFKRVRECPNHVFLADQFLECPGAVFARENLVAHGNLRRVGEAGTLA